MMLGIVGHSTTERLVARETSRLLRLAAPWAWLLASFPVALAVGALGGGSPIGAAVLTLATVVITALTWAVTRSHGPLTCYPAVFTAATGGVWITLASIFGISALWQPWLVTALVLAISHNIIAVYHRGSAKESPQKLLGSMLGLQGSRLALKPTDDGTAATGRWELSRGTQTTQDAQQRRGLVASAAGVAPEDVTIDTSRDHGVANVRIQLVDVHKNPTAWPGPAHPDGLPTEPLPIGVYRDNSLAALRIVTAEQGTRHQLTAGVSGSGKTNEARVEFCELATRRQTTQIVIDPLKAAQSLACVRDGLDMVIDNETLAERFLNGLPRYIQERSRHLGRLGLDNWAPGCGLNFVSLHIEEAHRFSDSTQLVAAALAFRSVGGRLVISTQRPTYTSINTTTRSQLTTVLAFGLTDGSDARIALGDEAVEAGADPSVWANRVPGMAYLLHPDADNTDRYMPLRAYNITPAAAQHHMQTWAPRRDPLDALTAQMLPEILGGTTVIPVSRPDWHRGAAAITPAPPSTSVEDHDDEPATPDPAPELSVDLNEPLAELPDEPLFSNQPRTSTVASAEQAREVLLDAIRITASHPNNNGRVNPGQLHHVTGRVGRTRTWIYEACRALARDGYLIDDPATGAYRLNPPSFEAVEPSSPTQPDTPFDDHRELQPVGALT